MPYRPERTVVEIVYTEVFEVVVESSTLFSSVCFLFILKRFVGDTYNFIDCFLIADYRMQHRFKRNIEYVAQNQRKRIFVNSPYIVDTVFLTVVGKVRNDYSNEVAHSSLREYFVDEVYGEVFFARSVLDYIEDISHAYAEYIAEHYGVRFAVIVFRPNVIFGVGLFRIQEEFRHISEFDFAEIMIYNV